MKLYLLSIIILLLFLLTACSQAPMQPICNKPYILVGTSCCLDLNNNKICDSDELAKETVEVKQETSVIDPLIEENPLILTYTPERVIDGDTFVLSTGEKVRLIGIDTPETYEDYFSEAKSRLEALIMGENLTLERDVSEKDMYGRLLRYVYVEDAFINLQLIAEGYAKAYPYPPDTKYRAEFADVEESAKQKSRGIWQVKEAEPITQSTPAPQPVSTSGAICSHNAYNCADFSSQAAAQRVFEECGSVSNDIHILDKDKDGVACESLV